MNKFYGNKIFALIVSFFLTMILFFYVKTEVHSNNAANLFNNVSEEVTETISDVPVHVTGDIDQYYVTGIPESVSVELKGPKNVINQTLQGKKFRVVTEDLAKLGAGTHYVQFKMENLSDEVSYRISPSTAEITISELESRAFPVEIQLNNREGVASGYEIASETTNPNSITLTGSKETLQQIKRVYVNLTLPNNQKNDYSSEVTVITEDANGKVLNLSPSPETVKATIAIRPKGKKVPIKIQTVNGDKNLTYEVSLPDDVKEVTVYGDSSVLNAISEVAGTVDLSDVTQSTEKEVMLNIPTNASDISPKEVQVTITVKSKDEASSAGNESTQSDQKASSSQQSP
ncbi:MAG: CdaR family protein [Aerococcus sp.]|nr:CdaR family protein [Aerococcus sp.]